MLGDSSLRDGIMLPARVGGRRPARGDTIAGRPHRFLSPAESPQMDGFAWCRQVLTAESVWRPRSPISFQTTVQLDHPFSGRRRSGCKDVLKAVVRTTNYF